MNSHATSRVRALIAAPRLTILPENCEILSQNLTTLRSIMSWWVATRVLEKNWFSGWRRALWRSWGAVLFARQYRPKIIGSSVNSMPSFLEDVPYHSAVGGKSIVRPRIFVPTPLLPVKLFEKGRVDYMKFLRADPNDGSYRQRNKSGKEFIHK